MARYIGASWQLDAFLIVFKLPNFFRRLFAEGAFSQALMPAVIHSVTPKQLLGHVYAWLCLLIILISMPFILFPKVVLGFFLYGQDPDGLVYQEAVRLLPWVFPYLGAMACCGFYVVQLNIRRVYTVGSLLPILLNICLIIGIAGYVLWKDILFVALGVFTAGILQVAVCLYYVGRRGVLWPRFSTGVDIHQMLNQTGIGFLAQLVSYCSALFDLFLVSFLAVGSMSWLYYAERLIYLPVGVVSVVLANILLNDLSHACRENNHEQMIKLLKQSGHLVVLVALPAMILAFYLADTIVSLLFASAYFQPKDVMATVNALKILAMAMPFLMINRVWTVVPYSFSEANVQLKMNSYAFLISGLTSMVLLPFLGYLAISFGLLASALIQSILLYRYIIQKIGAPLFDMEWLRAMLLAACWMIVVLSATDQYFWVNTSSKLGLLYDLVLRSSIALSSWGCFLYVFLYRHLFVL